MEGMAGNALLRMKPEWRCIWVGPLFPLLPTRARCNARLLGSLHLEAHYNEMILVVKLTKL